MGVIAKFYIDRLVLQPGVGGGQVVLKAAARGARNAQWAAASPSGELTMQINNPEAFDWFRDLLERSRPTDPGQATIVPEVFIRIDAANDGQAGDGHKFEASDVPENHYNAGKCAQCGFAADAVLHVSGGDGPPAHPNG